MHISGTWGIDCAGHFGKQSMDRAINCKRAPVTGHIEGVGNIVIAGGWVRQCFIHIAPL